MPRVSVSTGGRPGVGSGCLGSVLLVVFVVLAVLAVVAGAVVLLAIAGTALVLGLLVLAYDRIALALSPRRRARREAMWRGGVIDAPGGVIDAEATELPRDDQTG